MKLTTNQLKALDLQRNLAVTAGAGSGKTTVLVKRYLHILTQNPHLKVNNILAITFTEKATAEMKERIFADINQAFRAGGGQRERLFDILNQLHEAQVFTIHGFCSNLLRQYPLEAGVNPDYTVLDDLQADELLNQAFRDFFLNYDLENDPDSEIILRGLREYPVSDIRKFFFAVYRARPLLRNFWKTFSELNPAGLVKNWESLFVEYHRQILQPLLADQRFFSQLENLCRIPLENNDRAAAVQQALAENLHQWQQPGVSESARIQALIQVVQLLTTNDGSAYRKVPGGKKAWGEEGVELFLELSATAAQFSAGLLPIDFATEKAFAEVYPGLGLLFRKILDTVDTLKNRLNALDFDDLQLSALDLLQNHPGVCEQVRSRYPFILVDEFQDTDTLQSEILKRLTRNRAGQWDTNRLFVVGDPKQSIFAFRNADVSIFQDFLQEISRAQDAGLPFSHPETGAILPDTPENRRGIISLAENFRSSAALIRFFNRTFRTIFQRETGYDVPFQELEAARPEPDQAKSAIQLDLFFENEEEKTDLAQAQALRLAELIGKIVDNPDYLRVVVQEGEVVTETISYGDIAVLLRSRNHLEQVEEIFRRFHIPYQTHKGRGFFQKQEVQDLYYMLRSLSDPDDDFALLTFLRSSYLALSDVTLLFLSQVNGAGYFRKLQRFCEFLDEPPRAEDIFQPEFFQFLQENHYTLHVPPREKTAIRQFVRKFPGWNDLALRGRFSQLAIGLIDDLQIRALLTAQPDGEQKLANLDKFIHFIFDFEQSNSGLLADLLDTVEKQMVSGETEGEATVMAQEPDKVNILTVHSAKGMEFPVVMLPFLERKFRYNKGVLADKNQGVVFQLGRSANEQERKPFLYQFAQLQDRQKTVAEEKRLFYVAATRARDHLFLLGSIGKKGKVNAPSYLDWFLKAFQLQVDEAGDEQEFIHRDEQTAFRVYRHFGLKGADLSPEKPWEPSAPANLSGVFPDDALKYQQPITSQPGGQIYTVTQLMLFREDEARYFRHFYLRDGQVAPPQVELDYMDEPGGALWGSAVHKLLENFHLRAPEHDALKIRQILQQMALTGGKESREIAEKLAEMIRNFRSSPLGKQLATAEQKAEVALDMRLGDFLLRGIFDRLFKNSDGLWEVIDFKTNRIGSGEVETTAKKYAFQMQAYALLLSGLFPEQQTYPVTLYFLVPRQRFSRTFTTGQISAIRADVLALMNKVFDQEKQMFYASS